MENNNRDQFGSKIGFILACVGSAVGMANIWLFPYRLGQLGGAAFLIPYLLFVFLIGYTGVVEEMSFGRSMKTGPLGAFHKASQCRGSDAGASIGWIPVIGSLGIAIGYAIVVGWILRFTFGALSGSLLGAPNIGAYFGAIVGKFGSMQWHILALVIGFSIMSAGVASGIEKVNKIMMPAFFIMFLILAVRVVTLPGSGEGYKYLFHPDWAQLANPKTWVFALGQAFFSLSLAGSGTVVYGSYLSDKEDVTSSAMNVAIFDTIAAILAALVIIPAVFAYGIEVNAGPPLLFITMPEVFKEMPGGSIFVAVFFIAVLFAGITSLINLFETPVEALQNKFGLSRNKAIAIVGTAAFAVGIFVQDANVLGVWMDVVSIYIIPLGALLAAVMFFWVCPKKFAIDEMSKGRKSKVSEAFYSWGKYGFCGVTVLVCILGILYGGIG